MPVDSAAELQVHSSKEAGILLLLWSENTLKAACEGTAWLIRIRKNWGACAPPSCSWQLWLRSCLLALGWGCLQIMVLVAHMA